MSAIASLRKVLVTGATGFIGRAVHVALQEQRDVEVVGAARRASTGLQASPPLGPEADWSELLDGCDVVVHTAARAHILRDEVADPLSEYRYVNVEGTLSLARQAAEAGAERLIFLSSIGVNGNVNTCPFSEEDPPNPTELYAQSKWEAEQGLWQVQHDTGMQVVILRPPLVYGPGAPGNFGRLVRWVERGVPLPLGDVHNRRSLVARGNLVDLILTCINHPAAANQLFLAGDGQDLSTSELLRGVAQAMGRPVRLVPVPASLLRFAATLLGRREIAERLLGSLQVDISKARDVLGWHPPLTLEQGLAQCFMEESTMAEGRR